MKPFYLLILALLIMGCETAHVPMIPPGASVESDIHYLNVDNLPVTAYLNLSGVQDHYNYTVTAGRYWMPQGGGVQ